MAKVPITITRNHGGQSGDLKEGPEYSFAYSRHIDFRKKPTSLSILPKATKESGSVVTGMVTQMVHLPSGKGIAIDDVGGIYSRSISGTWTKDAGTVLDTRFGAVYNLQHDRVYIAGGNAIHTVDNADGRFTGGVFTPTSNVLIQQLDQSLTGGAATYTTTTAVNEGATHLQTFVPSLEPCYSIKIRVVTKGTGDVTVTMHDAKNNALGSVTKTAASLTNAAYNEFVFTAPVRTTFGRNGATYHFHVTHDSAGTATTIQTTTASNLETADFETYCSRLVDPTNKFHPMIEFLQYICIGNERYLAVWEPISQTAPSQSEFQQHRLTFPSGYEVTSLATWNEYLAIACEKRATSAVNAITEGKIFFWDGISTTYNFVLDITEGGPFSLSSHQNVLYYYAGGGWWAWSGNQPVLLMQFPDTDYVFSDGNFYAIGYPNVMAVRNRILLGGFPSETNNVSIEHGLYSFGKFNRNYQDSFGFDYSISTGTRTYDGANELRISMVKSVGDKTFVAWRDGTSYGIDKIDPNSDPYAEATYESLIIDNNRPDKTKEAVSIIIDFEALPTGATITPKYKIDRGAWVTGTAAVATDTRIKLSINRRYKEIQVGFNAVASTTTPVVIGTTFLFEDLATEKD